MTDPKENEGAPPEITVEFLGIPRERAGTAKLTVSARTLGELLTLLAKRCPRFDEACLTSDSQLKLDYLAAINGQHFTRQPTEQLRPGDVVLILSADVGG